MPLEIIPQSLTDTAALLVSPAAVVGLGVENLQVSDRGLVLRVLGSTATITATLTSLRRVDAVILWRHLLSVSSTVRVRLYDGIAGAGLLLLDTGTLPAVPSKSLGDLDWGVDLLGSALGAVDYTSVPFASVIARSLVIDVSDAGAAQIQIGRLFAGQRLVFRYAAAWGTSVEWDAATKRTRTGAGGLRVESQGVFRRIKLDQSWIDPSERSAVVELLRTAGDRREIWFSARAGEGGQFEADHALVGYLSDSPALQRLQGIRYSMPLVIEES